MQGVAFFAFCQDYIPCFSDIKVPWQEIDKKISELRNNTRKSCKAFLKIPSDLVKYSVQTVSIINRILAKPLGINSVYKEFSVLFLQYISKHNVRYTLFASIAFWKIVSSEIWSNFGFSVRVPNWTFDPILKTSNQSDKNHIHVDLTSEVIIAWLKVFFYLADNHQLKSFVIWPHYWNEKSWSKNLQLKLNLTSDSEAEYYKLSISQKHDSSLATIIQIG